MRILFILPSWLLSFELWYAAGLYSWLTSSDMMKREGICFPNDSSNLPNFVGRGDLYDSLSTTDYFFDQQACCIISLLSFSEADELIVFLNN